MVLQISDFKMCGGHIIIKMSCFITTNRLVCSIHWACSSLMLRIFRGLRCLHGHLCHHELIRSQQRSILLEVVMRGHIITLLLLSWFVFLLSRLSKTLTFLVLHHHCLFQLMKSVNALTFNSIVSELLLTKGSRFGNLLLNIVLLLISGHTRTSRGHLRGCFKLLWKLGYRGCWWHVLNCGTFQSLCGWS